MFARLVVELRLSFGGRHIEIFRSLGEKGGGISRALLTWSCLKVTPPPEIQFRLQSLESSLQSMGGIDGLPKLLNLNKRSGLAGVKVGQLAQEKGSSTVVKTLVNEWWTTTKRTTS